MPIRPRPATDHAPAVTATAPEAPQAPALTRADLRFSRGLEKREKQIVTRVLLRGRFDYMNDDRFHAPNAAKALFAGDDIDRPNCGWYAQLAYDPRDTPRELRPQALPLLTPAQEKVAFLRFNYCRFRVEQLRQQINPSRIAKARALALVEWHDKATHFRELIAEYNLGLVLAMARRLPSQHVDLPEMISEGNMALLRGIDKFDVSRGFKFSTYACRAILKAFSRQGIKNTKHKSLFPVAFEPDLERSNYQAERAQDEQQTCASEVRKIVIENRAGLTDLEQQVLENRFRFRAPDEQGLTLQQVGKLVGLTKERVRQIQIHAMDKIRTQLEQDYLAGPSLAQKLAEAGVESVAELVTGSKN